MKKVIDGRSYNTETAKKVAEYSYGEWGDWDRVEQTLYLTKNGSWFLAGEGGARSEYSRQVAQNRWSGGEDIRALTADEALLWLEEHSKTEAIEEHFADRVAEA